MQNRRSPYIFDEFFASGKEESISPFLTPHTRKWGKDLPLKSALLAAFFLCLAFALSFLSKPVSLLCLSSVYFLVGTPALLNALEDLRNVEINIDVLMTLAALLSILIGSGMEGALLLVLFELSAAMENMVTEKTKSALISLHHLSPKTAFVLDADGTLHERSREEIPVGANILIKAGEVIPLDGTVVAGSSFVNMVHLTGESEPIAKREKDSVQAGSQNFDGTLTVKVERVGADSTINRIIRLITQAQNARPKLERLFDRFGKWYSMSIILLAFVFGLSLPLIFNMPFLGEEGSIYRALTFLIAASPCALIIATPTAYLSAISACARKGILLKGGTILDALAKCKIIAFDKTGTLTTGQLSCTGIDLLMDAYFSKETAISIAAGLEKHATHPIGEAILKFARDKKLPQHPIQEFKSTPGYGLEGKVALNEKTIPVYIGHPDFIESKLSAEKQPLFKEQMRNWESQNTLLLIGEALYVLHFQDEIRPESLKVLPKLQKENIEILLLTGDHTLNAQVVSQSLNIKNVHANLRPEDKLAKVAELSEKAGLIMVGDGINDAPALARSTVGVSLGKIGSATAVDASDVVFLQDDLSLLDILIHKSYKTLRIIKQNLALALAVICLATTPALLGYIPLWLAVILHEGGTVIVGLNSLRLLK